MFIILNLDFRCWYWIAIKKILSFLIDWIALYWSMRGNPVGFEFTHQKHFPTTKEVEIAITRRNNNYSSVLDVLQSDMYHMTGTTFQLNVAELLRIMLSWWNKTCWNYQRWFKTYIDVSVSELFVECVYTNVSIELNA